MNIDFKIIGFIICFSLATAINANESRSLQIGSLKAAYYSGDHSNFKLLLDNALNGDPEAQFIIGESYFWGYGVDQSYSEAQKWYQISADNGNPNSLYWIAGNTLMGSKGFIKSTNKAIEYFERAAEKGHKGAICALIDLGNDDVQRILREHKKTKINCR
jgi:TPR repeat protein